MVKAPSRPLRLCDVCLEVDDHPRHVQLCAPGEGVALTPARLSEVKGAPASAIAEMLNGSTIIRHLNCCAEGGCETCIGSERENGGRRHQELIDHLAEKREARDDG